MSIDKFFSVKMTRGKFCSVENLSANAMMPDHNVNAGRDSSILLYKNREWQFDSSGIEKSPFSPHHQIPAPPLLGKESSGKETSSSGNQSFKQADRSSKNLYESQIKNTD